MRPMMHGDLRIERYEKQQYKVLFNMKTGAFVRMEDEGAKEPFWCMKGPELIDVSITNYCTRECDFCYRQSNREGMHLSMESIRDVVSQAKDAGVLQIALGGGNPNQHPNFVEILKLIRESSMVPSYTSNGIGLSDSILEATKKYCGAMAISFYPPYDEDYYHSLIENITSFGIRLNLHVILKNDLIEMLTKWLREPPLFFNKLNAIIFLNYKPIGGNREYMVKDVVKLKNFFEAADKCKSIKIGFDSCSMSGVAKWMKNIKSEFLESCEAARFSAFISEDMKMYPCSFMVGTNLYGDLRKYSLKEIWQKSLAFSGHRRKILEHRCNECPNIGICNGGCLFLPEINMCNYIENS